MNGGVSDMYDFFETQTEKCLKVNLFTNPSVNIVSALKMSPENPLLLLSRPDPLKPLTVGRNDGTFFVPELRTEPGFSSLRDSQKQGRRTDHGVSVKPSQNESLSS